jgi:hypothetical protein
MMGNITVLRTLGEMTGSLATNIVVLRTWSKPGIIGAMHRNIHRKMRAN